MIVYLFIGVMIGIIKSYAYSMQWRSGGKDRVWRCLYGAFFPLDSAGIMSIYPLLIDVTNEVVYIAITALIWPITIIWSAVVWSMVRVKSI